MRPFRPWRGDIRRSHTIKNSGSYIIILCITRDIRIRIGRLGILKFKKGYYLYVGSAKTNLTKRIERHKRKRKRFFWHIDYLRNKAKFCTALPIRTSATLECPIANRLREITDWSIPGFGSSDCSCETHLFGMHKDPIKSTAFIETLLYYRIDRLEEKLPSFVAI